MKPITVDDLGVELHPVYWPHPWAGSQWSEADIANMLRDDPEPWPLESRHLRPVEGEYEGSGFCRRWVGGAG